MIVIMTPPAQGHVLLTYSDGLCKSTLHMS
jgi:hypothetical protein